MRKNIGNFLLVIVVVVIFASCKKMTKISDIESEKFQAVLNSNEDDGVSKGGKSNAEKQWKKLYKTCGKSFIFDKPNFLGLSNNKGIGLVINKDNGRILQLPPSYTKEDSAKFISEGSIVPMCAVDINRDFDVNLLFSGVFARVAVDSLGASFSRAKSRKIAAGNWFQVDAATDAMYDHIKQTPSLANYKSSVEKPEAYVVTGAIYVSNFDAELEYETNISMGLKLKKDTTYKAPLKGEGEMEVRYDGDKKITIRCNSLFVPLAVLSKIN